MKHAIANLALAATFTNFYLMRGNVNESAGRMRDEVTRVKEDIKAVKESVDGLEKRVGRMEGSLGKLQEGIDELLGRQKGRWWKDCEMRDGDGVFGEEMDLVVQEYKFLPFSWIYGMTFY